MFDALIYSAIACVALVPALVPVIRQWAPLLTIRPVTPTPAAPEVHDDWRQVWVTRLMDLQRVLEEEENKQAAATTKQLITQIIYDGQATK